MIFIIIVKHNKFDTFHPHKAPADNSMWKTLIDSTLAVKRRVEKRRKIFYDPTSIFMTLNRKKTQRHRHQFKTIKNLRIINWICHLMVFVKPQATIKKYEFIKISLPGAHVHTFYNAWGAWEPLRGKSRLRDKFE